MVRTLRAVTLEQLAKKKEKAQVEGFQPTGPQYHEGLYYYQAMELQHDR